MRYRDRTRAGRALVPLLGHLRGPATVVLGLPRGGVPVAYEVAVALGAPLDILPVGRIGAPFQPELPMGAVGEDRVVVRNDAVLRERRVSVRTFGLAARWARADLARQAVGLRAGHPRVSLAGRVALLVDDGVATGATARAACLVARAHRASRVVFAAPVGTADAIAGLRTLADEVVCPLVSDRLYAVGAWYDDFSPTSEAQVRTALDRVGAAHRSDIDRLSS